MWFSSEIPRSVILTACHHLMFLDAAATPVFATKHGGRDPDGIFFVGL
jgi:hypothetical protein